MKKKIIGILLSSVMMVSMMGGMAYAASPEATEAGVYDLQILQNEVTVVPMTADQTAITSKNVLIDGQEAVEYEGTERFQVTVANTADQKFYLVIAKDEDAAPTEQNLKYIDQKTSSDGSVIFDVYPSELRSGNTYYIALSSNAGNGSLENIASFKYFEAYMPGDVNDDKVININDAMAIINHIVKRNLIIEPSKLKAADVTGDDVININDVMEIINYINKRPQYLK